MTQHKWIIQNKKEGEFQNEAMMKKLNSNPQIGACQSSCYIGKILNKNNKLIFNTIC